jgi:hypothetical protein
VKAVFKCSSVRRLRNLDLIILMWENASSQSQVDLKMLTDEELLIELRRQINFDIDQKTAAVDW